MNFLDDFLYELHSQNLEEVNEVREMKKKFWIILLLVLMLVGCVVNLNHQKIQVILILNGKIADGYNKNSNKQQKHQLT